MKYFQSKIKSKAQHKNASVGEMKSSKKFIMLPFLIIATSSCVPIQQCAVYAENSAFQVNVKESMSVSITSPDTPANGNIDTFLRNKYTLNVSSNNTSGFTASMYAVGDTNLTNTSFNDQSIPTLSSSTTRGSFPANFWGYSLGTTDSLNNHTYNETEIGNANSTYYPLVSTSATPITVLTSDGGGSSSQDIYFGAKASAGKAAGTYSGIVVISVVSGVINDTDNPITPTNPAGSNAEDEVAQYTPAPTGGSSNGTTTYTYRRTNPTAGTNTVTTQVSDGDNRDAYSGYTPPQGAKENTTSSISTESSMAAGLATTAIVATSTGMFFFIVAKRREDDDDDEEA